MMGQINLLSDRPTIEDSFAHNKVASAISNLILEEEGSKTIALKGGWGSGKSSIVEMVKDKLGEKCNVFVFDAWAHEGDPLRRSFLESLTTFFLHKRLIDNIAWEKKRNELRNRIEKTTSVDFVKPTGAGIILFLTTILAPFGLVLLSLWPNLSMPYLNISVILSLTPFIIAISILFFALLPNKDKEKRKKIISLLINQTDKQIETNTSKTIDPTSIEFQEIFFEILQVVFSKCENKLLIVIDNLDRIDPEEALKIWATMRTFFDFEQSNNRTWQKKTWLLIPYDYNGIKKLWDNKNQTDNHTLVTSFTDKTFQIIFDTPPIILSDSSKYFSEQLETCFGKKIETSEIHKIYRIFKAHRNLPLTHITPREIKIFINNLAALVRESWSEIPLHVLALYTALRSKLSQEELIGNLQIPDNGLIDKAVLDLVDNNYRQYLSALLFKVDGIKATTALLRDKIETALTNLDLDFFSQNQQLPGFTEILDEYISERLPVFAENEPHIITNVALCLDTLDIEKDSYLNNCWFSTKNNLHRITHWRSFNKQTVDGLLIMLKLNPPTQTIINITKCFSNSPDLFLIQKPTGAGLMLKKEEEARKQLLEILRFLEWLYQNEYVYIIENHFKINITKENYLALLNILSEIDAHNHLLPFFNTTISAEEILSLIAHQITIGLEENNVSWKTLDLFYKINDGLNNQRIIEAAEERLEPIVTQFSPNELYLLIKILLYSSMNNELALSKLKKLTLGGAIPNHFHITLTKSQHYEAAAICLFCLIKLSPDGRLDSSPGSSRAGITEFKNIKANPENYEGTLLQYIFLLKEFNEVDSLLKLSETNDSFYPLIKQIIKLICEKESSVDYFSSKEIIVHEKLFFDALGYDKRYNSLVNVFTKEKDLINEIIKTDFSVSLSSLYLSIIKDTNNKNVPLIEYLIVGLNNLTLDVLKEELNLNYTNVFDLIIELVKNHIQPQLKSPLEELLIAEVEDYISNNTIHDILKDNWPYVINALEVNHKNAFLANIRFKITNLDEDLSELFDLFGDILLDGKIFMDDINNVINIGFKNMINRNNLAEIIWLNNFFSANPTILKSNKAGYATTFKDSIKRKKNEEALDNTLREQYSILAKTLKIHEK